MGYLENGVWHNGRAGRHDARGNFLRQESRFRGRVTRDGSSGYRATPGRYHLYVSLACPWAHRTLIFRALKGLDNAISVSIVDPLMLDDGWTFSESPGCVPDTVNGARYLREVDTKADAHYSGRVTVPVLWDRATKTSTTECTVAASPRRRRRTKARSMRCFPRWINWRHVSTARAIWRETE